MNTPAELLDPGIPGMNAQPIPQYRVVCAWCGDLIRLVADEPAGTSHGICDACKEKHFPGFEDL